MTHRYRIVLALLGLLWLPLQAQAQTFFTGEFSAAQETEDVTSDATGTAALALTDEGLRYIITVDGLTGDITGAHFHEGAAGISGGVVHGITDAFDGTAATGIWTPADGLTDEMIADLFAGNIYLNVHTAANPGGEVRAQLYPSSGAGLTAHLTAEQEPGDVDSDGAGTATIQATDAGVAFYVTVSGLSGPITNAHFHEGPVGVNGGVVHGIMDDFDGNTAFGLWTRDDDQALTDDLLATLLTGGLYLNIHTAAYGGGEIRGQVLLTSGFGFSASLDAGQETHDVSSDATGTAALTLTEQGLAYRLTVDGLTGPITNAHFHLGAPGVSGGVVHGIFDQFDGNTAAGVWMMDDMSDENLQALLRGDLYLNIHTEANPGGEIRGQVLLNEGTSLSATLTGAQNDVEADGTGTAAMTLTNEGLAFEVTITGLTGPLNSAHFHQGAVGVNGGVVRTITGDFKARQTVTLQPSKDNTLFEDDAGALSNGAGDHLFVGRTNQSEGSIRRALLAFDVASAVPDGATIERVELSLNMSKTVAGPTDVTVHRLQADWGEGTSDAAGDEGPGVDATTDDATWIHTFFDSATWSNSGGDFAPAASASADVTDLGVYTWRSPALADDVRAWLDDPASNFGWLLMGDESELMTAKRFDSRESDNPPTLRITYSTPSTMAATASGLWSEADGGEALTPEYIAALLAGDLYLNVHTEANPGGEIRGQVYVNGGTALTASLTGAQNGVEADGTGTAAMTLTDEGLAFAVTVDGLSGAINAAHFHQGALGVNGGVVRDIEFDGNTATGFWSDRDGDQALTDEMIEALVTGDLYVNVHTAANPGGEIRGQVRLASGFGAAVQLDAAQELHEVTADATGAASLTLTDAGVVYDLTVTDLTGPLTMAHFHEGNIFISGAPIRTITDAFTDNTAEGLWSERDGNDEALTDKDIAAVLAGHVYLNVHTDANPAGELRGQVNADGVVVTAIDPDDDQVPEAIVLKPNYPNPFNPATTIEFALPRSTRAVLSVYNLLGQQVETLLDTRMNAGTYQVTFDAANLPSGVYFYRLEADGVQQTRRMLLLK